MTAPTQATVTQTTLTYSTDAQLRDSHSMKLVTVTLSSCETEYIALTDAIKEVLWLKQLLGEIGFEQGAVNVFIDNKSVIQLIKFVMLCPRNKHIGMRHHWIREKVVVKEIELIYIKISKNMVDMFTKNLDPVKM